MPRRNRTPKHTRFEPSKDSETKKRFATKTDAERAVNELKKYHHEIELAPYQSTRSGSWYLTSKKVDSSMSSESRH